MEKRANGHFSYCEKNQDRETFLGSFRLLGSSSQQVRKLGSSRVKEAPDDSLVFFLYLEVCSESNETVVKD